MRAAGKTAGQVEVHVKDTDIIYMLEGTTTFVTGGTMVGGKPSAQDEIRGSSVEGGETRTLTKGDVIIVPKGTPALVQRSVSGQSSTTS